MNRTLLQMAQLFALMSMLSFGGGSSVLAEMQRQVVDHGWTSPREFLDFYAIARAAPGPGMNTVALIGWHVASWQGALVCATAMFLPSGLMIYLLTRFAGRLPETRLKLAVQDGLAPLAVGLTFASVIALLRGNQSPVIAAVTAAALAAVLARWKINPLFPLILAGLVYLAMGWN